MLAVVGAARAPARADLGPASRSIVVTTGSCSSPPWSARAWSELLAVELAADRIAVALAERAPGGDAPVVDVEPAGCDAATTAAALTCTSGGVRRTRQLDLADVAPVARPRVIAIAVADAVRTCAPVSAAPGVDVAVPVSQPVRSPPPGPIVLGALGEGRVYTANAGNTTGVYGPRAFVDVPLLAYVVARADIGVLFATASDPLGTISGTLASLGICARGAMRVGGFQLGLGLRGELGYGWFRGGAGAPTVMATRASSSLAYLGASAVASTHLSGDLGAELDLDLGNTVRGFAADADARQVFDVEGVVLALRLGLTWSLPRR